MTDEERESQPQESQQPILDSGTRAWVGSGHIGKSGKRAAADSVPVTQGLFATMTPSGGTPAPDTLPTPAPESGGADQTFPTPTAPTDGNA
jgi:hypothetical protein